MSDVADSQPFPVVDPRAVKRKVAMRIIPLVFILYVIAYLDRANAGFAKTPMQLALGFSDRQFGMGFGIFFIGYLLLEIPGLSWSSTGVARKWFTRIMITWGICSMATAWCARPGSSIWPDSYSVLRRRDFFLALSFISLTGFRADRARALAGMVLGIPVSLALGARLSGWLLEVGWFGWDGWQWVFVAEGLPAVLIGLAFPLCSSIGRTKQSG